MRLHSARLVSLFLAAAISAAGPSAARAETLKPIVHWSGTVADPKLEKKAPESSAVTNAKDFAALWKAWRGAEQLPEIDFDAYFVVVVTLAKREAFVGSLELDKDGRGLLMGRKKLGEEVPGFGYGLGLFPRAKVKSIGGVELKRE